MATSPDDVKKLREKISQLEATVDKLHSKIDRQKRDHEAELNNALVAIETLRITNEQTQGLYLQATHDLEEARVRIEVQTRKAKERKSQIKALKDAKWDEVLSPKGSPNARKSRARSATISVSSTRHGFYLDDETESLRQIVASLNDVGDQKSSHPVRPSVSSPLPPPKPPKPASPKVQHNTWSRSNSKSMLFDDFGTNSHSSTDDMSTSSFSSLASTASTPIPSSSDSSDRKPKRTYSYNDVSSTGSPSPPAGPAAQPTTEKRGSFNEQKETKPRDLGHKLSLTVTCGTLTVSTVVYSEWTVSEVLQRLKSKFPLEAPKYGLYIREKSKSQMKEMPEDKRISQFKSIVSPTDPTKMPTLIYKEKVGRKNATSSIKRILSLGKDTKPTLSLVMDAILSENIPVIESILISVSSHTLLEFNKEGHAPIHAAVNTNNLRIVRLFLDLYRKMKVDINIPDNVGWTLLHHAVWTSGGNAKEEEMLSLLLEFPGIQVDVVNNDLNTPLHYFCQRFSSPACQALGESLIKKAPDTVNRRNKNGETPLHKAIFNTTIRVLMVKLLINNQADVNLPSTKAGETALHYASRLGRRDLIKILLLAGADTEIQDTAHKRTPYELAVSLKQHEVSNMLDSVKELSQWLTEIEMMNHFYAFLKEEIFVNQIIEDVDAALDKVGITDEEEREKIKKCQVSLKEKMSVKHFEQRIINASKDKRLSIGHQDAGKLADLKRNLDEFQGSDAWSIAPEDLEFTKELGSGRSGVVFKGLYKGIKVAIKVLAAHTAEATLQEFKKEFHVTSTVRSPHVVKFYGACVEPRLLIVMEYCSRGSLYHILSNDKIEIGWDRAYRFVTELVGGLNTLHTFDPPVYHRDMKSLNLLVTKTWDVKICDFGLARFNTPLAMDTMQKLCGTYSYTAPELYSKGTFTDKCDVFSTGIILWEIVYRVVHGKYEAPYLKDNPHLQRDFQILHAVANKGLRPIIPKETPPALADIIKRCLDANPAQRPTTAQLLEDLQKARSSLPIGPKVNHRKPDSNSLRLSVGSFSSENVAKDAAADTVGQ